MKKQNPIRIFGLTPSEISLYQQIAFERYGKASVSLLARKLLQELGQPESTNIHHQKRFERLTLRLPPKQQDYLIQKAQLHHSSLNDLVRDIIAEYITRNPVLNNDEVQALYQSNYQLLRIGRNINQLARQFNAIFPQFITTQQLNELADFLERHTEQVGKILRKQDKTFKYCPIRALNHETTKQTN